MCKISDAQHRRRDACPHHFSDQVFRELVGQVQVDHTHFKIHTSLQVPPRTLPTFTGPEVAQRSSQCQSLVHNSHILYGWCLPVVRSLYGDITHDMRLKP